MSKTNKISKIYIVGGGPSGIMCAYRLKQLDSSLNVIIFEENSNTFDDYKSKGYDKISKWQKAMYDISFTKVMGSKDNNDLLMGSGLGGGTLHFGLQYIDQIDVLSKSCTEFRSDEFKEILIDISNITQVKSYDYSNNVMPTPLEDLKNVLDNSQNYLDYSNNIIVKNNKIYSRDLVNRFLLGDLIKDMGINIIYGSKVNQLLIDDFNNITGITLLKKDIVSC